MSSMVELTCLIRHQIGQSGIDGMSRLPTVIEMISVRITIMVNHHDRMKETI